MKIDRHVRFFISIVCIGIWLIAGNSAAFGASADQPPGPEENAARNNA